MLESSHDLNRFRYLTNLREFVFMEIVEPLTKETKLRRYLSHKKLLDLLKNKIFFISRLDGFINRIDCPDKFEATYTQFFLDLVPNPDRRDIILKTTYISCWNNSTNDDGTLVDNVALWRLYNGGFNNCVAIDTTIENIENQLDTKSNTFSNNLFNPKIQGVKYIDHHHSKTLHVDKNKNLDLPITKNIGYKFEHEVRIIYSLPENIKVRGKQKFDTHENYYDEKGLVLNIDPNKLITKIIINPEADDFYIDYISELLKKLQLNIAVEWSPLKYTPNEQP